MTDIEILNHAVQTLGAINVPVGLLDQIGAPIYAVRKNLLLLIEAVQKNAEDKKEDTTEAPVEEATE